MEEDRAEDRSSSGGAPETGPGPEGDDRVDGESVTDSDGGRDRVTSAGRTLNVSFDRSSDTGTVLARVLFGDRLGLALFLGSVVAFTLLWIAGWRINDTFTLLNALHGMKNGHLYVDAVEYGVTIESPGAVVANDRIYGRNYGILTIALIPLAVLEVLTLVTELRVAFAGLWSLAILALSLVLGSILDRRREAARWGSVLALLLFVLNVALATPLDPSDTELYALQLTHVVAAAFVVVLTYRLLASVHDVRVGLFGAGLVVLGTPLGLWASVPKRHVVTAAVVFAVGYALYRSRSPTLADPYEPVTFRAGAYALVGLLAWVHAPEALVLLVVLAAVDVPTAGNDDRRTLGLIAAAFLASLLPFLLTNYLVSGSPLEPPRMLPGADSQTGELAPGSGGAGGGGGGGGSSGGLLGDGPLGTVLSGLGPLTVLLDLAVASAENAWRKPGELWTVFVRSGYVDSIASEAHHESVNLSVLESAPVLAALVGVVPAARESIGDGLERASLWPLSPTRVLDAYLATFAVALSLTYLSKLPVHAQITVRYLFPLFPVLAYFVARTPAVRGVARHHWRLCVWTVATGVLVGGQLVVAALAVMEPGMGEAFQFHATLGLVLGAVTGAWALAGRSDGRWGQAGAVLIGLCLAATTVFLLLVTLSYFTSSGQQLLPIVRALGRVVSLV